MNPRLDENINLRHIQIIKNLSNCTVTEVTAIKHRMTESVILKILYDIDKISIDLDAIINAYKLSGVSLLIDIGNTLANWKKEIINSFHTYDGRRINNGPIEGRNKYVRIILILAMGYKNFKLFQNRILYVFNKHEKSLDKPLDTRQIKLPGKERRPYKKK